MQPRYAEMAGKEPEGTGWTSGTPGISITTLGEIEREYRSKGGGRSAAIVQVERPDGKDNIVEYTGVPIEMRGKKYTIGIDRDVTRARTAEHLEHQSQIRYQQLLRGESESSHGL